MLHGQGYNNFYNQVEPEPQTELSWLDYLILSNPQGVMKVLAGYGYTGYLAPQNENEMLDACMGLMDKYGEQAVVDLLKSHPLYDVFSDLSTQERSVSFQNASGDSITTIIKTIDYRSLINNAFIIIGAFFLATRLWGYLAGKGDA